MICSLTAPGRRLTSSASLIRTSARGSRRRRRASSVLYRSHALAASSSIRLRFAGDDVAELDTPITPLELGRRLRPRGPRGRGCERARLERVEASAIVAQRADLSDDPFDVATLRHERVLPRADVLVVTRHVEHDRGAPAVEHLERRPEHALDRTELQQDVARAVDLGRLLDGHAREHARHAGQRRDPRARHHPDVARPGLARELHREGSVLERHAEVTFDQDARLTRPRARGHHRPVRGVDVLSNAVPDETRFLAEVRREVMHDPRRLGHEVHRERVRRIDQRMERLLVLRVEPRLDRLHEVRVMASVERGEVQRGAPPRTDRHVVRAAARLVEAHAAQLGPFVVPGERFGPERLLHGEGDVMGLVAQEAGVLQNDVRTAAHRDGSDEKADPSLRHDAVPPQSCERSCHRRS